MGMDFHISDVLSISTGRLLSNRHMECMYDILGYMTSENLYTHQLPRAMRQCQLRLMAQYPGLPDSTAADAYGVNESNCQAFVALHQATFGVYLDIEPLPPSEDGPRDPIQGAVEMFGKDQVIVVDTPAHG